MVCREMEICRKTLYKLIGSEKPFSVLEAIRLVESQGGVSRIEPGTSIKEALGSWFEYGLLSYKDGKYISKGAA